MSIMNYNNPIFFDVETSGLDHKKNEIIQLSAYSPVTDNEFNEYLEFDISKADEEALKINHYNEKLWERKAIKPLKACQKFRDFLSEHKSVERVSKKSGKTYQIATLAGHCAFKFDMFFLYELFDKYHEFLPADFRCFDTMQLALWGLSDLEDYTLSGLAKYFNISSSYEKFHDALIDCKVNATVGAYLLRSLRAPLPRWAKDKIKQNIEDNDIPF